jgi:hypothetical protein
MSVLFHCWYARSLSGTIGTMEPTREYYKISLTVETEDEQTMHKVAQAIQAAPRGVRARRGRGRGRALPVVRRGPGRCWARVIVPIVA